MAKSIRKIPNYSVHSPKHNLQNILYLKGDFPINIWDHFETHGPITIYNIEGYRLKKQSGTAHPKIHMTIELFQLVFYFWQIKVKNNHFDIYW